MIIFFYTQKIYKEEKKMKKPTETELYRFWFGVYISPNSLLRLLFSSTSIANGAETERCFEEEVKKLAEQNNIPEDVVEAVVSARNALESVRYKSYQ